MPHDTNKLPNRWSFINASAEQAKRQNSQPIPETPLNSEQRLSSYDNMGESDVTTEELSRESTSNFTRS